MPNLSNIVTPVSQTKYIDPYQARVWQYDQGVNDYGVYLSKLVNSLYKIFGNNIVINGLDVIVTPNTTNNKTYDVTFGSGSLIQDSVLIEIELETHIYNAFDLSAYDDSITQILVFVDYQYIESVEENKAKFATVLINKNTHEVVAGEFAFVNTVLGVFNFTKASSGDIIDITSTTDNWVDIYDGVQTKRFYKNGYNTDDIRPLHKFLYEFSNPGPDKMRSTDSTGKKVWIDIPANLQNIGQQNFTQLIDVPHDYSGQSGKIIIVNLNEDGLDFEDSQMMLGQTVVTLNTYQEIDAAKRFKEDVQMDGNLHVLGNFIVNGTTTTINEIEHVITDRFIVLNNGEIGPGITSIYAGIQIDRGNGTSQESKDVFLRFNEDTNRFEIYFEGDTQGDPILTETYPSPGGVTLIDAGTHGLGGTQYTVKAVDGNLILHY